MAHHLVTEGTPGAFYSVGANPPEAAFSITSQGAITTLATFTANGASIASQLVSAANKRFYSASQISLNPIIVFSVTSTPGKKTYAAQSMAPDLTPNLPDESLLGVGFNTTGDSTSLNAPLTARSRLRCC